MKVTKKNYLKICQNVRKAGMCKMIPFLGHFSRFT